MKRTCCFLAMLVLLSPHSAARAQRCVRGGVAQWTTISQVGSVQTHPTDSIVLVANLSNMTVLLECYYSRNDSSINQAADETTYKTAGIVITLRGVTGAGTYDVHSGQNTARWQAPFHGEQCMEMSGSITIDRYDTNMVISGSFAFIAKCNTSGNWKIRNGSFRTSNPQIELLDPVPDFVDANGNLLTDLSKLKSLPSRLGTIADGVSKLLLVIHTTSKVGLYLAGLHDGYLANLDGTPISEMTTETPVVAGTDTVVVVVYTPPPVWQPDKPEDSAASKRPVAVYVHTYDGAITAYDTIVLSKLPVVMVHGMWSSPAAWDHGFASYFQANGYHVEKANYGIYSAETFDPLASSPSHGIAAVQTAIATALSSMRTQGIAADQVDVIAHSLGGLMTRGLIAQDALNKVSENFKKGYVHRLITIGTPHLGSPLGPLLFDANAVQQALVNKFIGPIGLCHRDFDYAGHPQALRNLGAATVPCHAVIATWKLGAGGDLALLGGVLSYIFPLTFPSTTLTYPILFGAEADQNDLIVAESSQRGQLSGQNVTEFTSTVHSDIAFSRIGTNTDTRSPAIMYRAKWLLSQDSGSPFLASAFPAASRFEQRHDIPQSIASALSLDTTSLKITAPAARTIFHPGDTIHVAAQSSRQPSSAPIVSISGLGLDSMRGAGPFADTIVLPKDCALGNCVLSVLGATAQGDVLLDTIPITIASVTAPAALVVEPVSITFDANLREVELYVHALYDTNDVDVTHGGVVYSTSHGTSIVTVTSDGTVNAVAAGSDTIAVSFMGQTVSVPVTVQSLQPLSVAPKMPDIPQIGTLSVWPNPATGSITVATDLVGARWVELIDLLGRTVSTSAVTGSSTVLDVSHLASGCYPVRVVGSERALERMVMVE